MPGEIGGDLARRPEALIDAAVRVVANESEVLQFFLSVASCRACCEDLSVALKRNCGQIVRKAEKVGDDLPAGAERLIQGPVRIVTHQLKVVGVGTLSESGSSNQQTAIRQNHQRRNDICIAGGISRNLAAAAEGRVEAPI